MAENQVLIQKLDHFIRKYYKNRLLRGLLWTLGTSALFYLVFVTLEFFFHFSQTGRTILFFSFFLMFFFLLGRLIFIPFLQLIKIGKIISYDQAAKIIGNHFSEIQDKLLNTLQLIRQQKIAGENSDLLAASIQQKTDSLKVFRFNVVVDFRKNIRFLRYAMIPLAIILLLVVVSPATISDPTRRILEYNQDFTPAMLFNLEILDSPLTAVQQEDFELHVKATGSEIPAELFIKSGEGIFKMNRGKGFVFTHIFKSLQGDVRFRLISGGYASPEYKLKVFPKATILNFEVTINYPGYISKPPEKFENQGDFVVPEGSILQWKFFTKDVSSINMRFGSESFVLSKESKNTYIYEKRADQAVTYCITPVNGYVARADSLKYSLNVVGDGFPSIVVNEAVDSILSTNLFIRGTIKDDYGFSNLTYNYAVFTKGDTAKKDHFTKIIPFERSINNQVFYYAVDLMELMPNAGQSIEYYFEVWDNDGIRGPKSTKSELKVIETPTLEEISNRTENNAELMNQDIQKSLMDAKEVKNSMLDLKKRLVDQTGISWQEKKRIQDLIKAHEAIAEKVEQVKKMNSENIAAEEKYLQTSERIIEKQKQLNEMMDQMLSEELKKMIQEMRAMLENIDKEKLGNLLEKMKMSNKELEKQLDRNLALLKQIEFERKLESVIGELRKRAEELEKLAAETENQAIGQDKLLEKQKDIASKIDSLVKKSADLEKEGKELETPVDIGDKQNKRDSIKENLANSEKKLNSKKNKESAGSQKKAAKQMKELAQEMEESQEESEGDQLAEDAANVRMILENLVRLSFDEEAMLASTRQIARNDPRYPELVMRQKEFSGKLKVVEDSLNAIAKRQLLIKPILTKEISAIILNIGLALEAMESRNMNLAVAKQQYTMTAINNLALLLNESLQKMNEQMSSSMKSKSGNKSCNKPNGSGKGKPSAKSMKELQQSIGKQLERLKAGMDGSKKDGKGSKVGEKGLSKEMAKLAAQQEALRNEMQRYQDEMGSQGVRDQGGLKEAAREMEQIERDLINKNINQQTINRQQSIVTRLLESEKAEQMREQEEKRESTEAKTAKYSNPTLNSEYNAKSRASQDDIQLIVPEVNLFYKNKVNSYIVKIEN